MKTERISIRDEFIRLDNLLKLAGAAPTGGMIKLLIQQGQVMVGEEICTQRGKKMRPGDFAVLEQDGEKIRVEVAGG